MTWLHWGILAVQVLLLCMLHRGVFRSYIKWVLSADVLRHCLVFLYGVSQDGVGKLVCLYLSDILFVSWGSALLWMGIQWAKGHARKFWAFQVGCMVILLCVCMFAHAYRHVAIQALTMINTLFAVLLLSRIKDKDYRVVIAICFSALLGAQMVLLGQIPGAARAIIPLIGWGSVFSFIVVKNIVEIYHGKWRIRDSDSSSACLRSGAERTLQ